MKKLLNKLIICVIFFQSSSVLSSVENSLEQKAKLGISQLQKEIYLAEKDGINVEKEKMTLRTAEIFMRYATWDEQNQDLNKKQFSLIQTYKNGKKDKKGRNLSDVVAHLPNHQRAQIVHITNAAIDTISEIRRGKIKRPELRTIDYSKLRVKQQGNNQIIVESVNGVDVPSFFYDYTFKPNYVLSDINDPDSKRIYTTDYHGNHPDLYVSPSFILPNGHLKSEFERSVETKIASNNNISRMFFSAGQVPSYIREDNANKSDSKSIFAGQRWFVKYDIDNPQAELFTNNLINKSVPNYVFSSSERLGYMLANEPHWATIESDFFTPNTTGNRKDKCRKNPTCNFNLISFYTIKKFEHYIKDLYGISEKGLAKLNRNWFGENKSNYLSSFSEISGEYKENQMPKFAINLPIKKNDIGSPMVYDWFRFNNKRVTDWFKDKATQIKKHDPEARTHIKLIPLFFSSRKTRDAGLDFEALQEIQDMIGNDADTNQELMSGKHEKWADKYSFHWSEMALAFDFLSSVKPGHINFNSENHYVSTNQFRDLYLDPEYVRAAFWLAYMLGENVSHIWYWPREVDGSIRKASLNWDTGYAASLIHQPSIVDEIGSIFYDLNANAPDIYEIQNARKQIRIFHSETSAINHYGHMDNVFDAYENVFFEGVNIGFVTERIIARHDISDWDVLIVYKTPSVSVSEIESIQKVLNAGGVVIIDQESLLKDEYGHKHKIKLNTSKGGEIIIASSLSEMNTLATEIIKKNGNYPAVNLTEKNDLKVNTCVWRVLEKNDSSFVVSVVNIGKSNSEIEVNVDGHDKFSVTSLLNGKNLSEKFAIEPNGVRFFKVAL